MIRRVTLWQASDGSVHERRADAVAHDREYRRSKSGVQYHFLICATVETREAGRLPSNTDLDPDFPEIVEEGSGEAMHWYSAPAGESLERAVARAIRRCRSVNARFPYAWTLDYEASITVDGKPVDGRGGWVDLYGVPTYNAFEFRV